MCIVDPTSCQLGRGPNYQLRSKGQLNPAESGGWISRGGISQLHCIILYIIIYVVGPPLQCSFEMAKCFSSSFPSLCHHHHTYLFWFHGEEPSRRLKLLYTHRTGKLGHINCILIHKFWASFLVFFEKCAKGAEGKTFFSCFFLNTFESLELRIFRLSFLLFIWSITMVMHTCRSNKLASEYAYTFFIVLPQPSENDLNCGQSHFGSCLSELWSEFFW